MSQSEKPKPPATAPRRQTPRVPSTVLYDKVLPIVLVVAAIVLVIILIVVVLGAGQSY
jgi:cell division protein FtsL